MLWKDDIIKLENEIKELRKNIETIKPLDVSVFENRLKEIELWQSKLHALMIEKTPREKDKLTKFGAGVSLKYGKR